MTEDQVRALVIEHARPFIREGGAGSGRGAGKGCGIRPWVKHNGLISSHVSEFMSGKRRASTSLLAALGLEYRIMPRRITRKLKSRNRLEGRSMLFQIASDARKGKQPCGECHLREGEICDICGAAAPAVSSAAFLDWRNANYSDGDCGGLADIEEAFNAGFNAQIRTVKRLATAAEEGHKAYQAAACRANLAKQLIERELGHAIRARDEYEQGSVEFEYHAGAAGSLQGILVALKKHNCQETRAVDVDEAENA